MYYPVLYDLFVVHDGSCIRVKTLVIIPSEVIQSRDTPIVNTITNRAQDMLSFCVGTATLLPQIQVPSSVSSWRTTPRVCHHRECKCCGEMSVMGIPTCCNIASNCVSSRDQNGRGIEFTHWCCCCHVNCSQTHTRALISHVSHDARLDSESNRHITVRRTKMTASIQW